MKFETIPNEPESQMLIELLEGYGEMYSQVEAKGELGFARSTGEGRFWGRAYFHNGRLDSLVFVPPVEQSSLEAQLNWYKISNIPERGLVCTTYTFDLSLLEDKIISQGLKVEPAVVRRIADTLTNADNITCDSLLDSFLMDVDPDEPTQRDASPKLISRILRRLSYMAVFGTGVSEYISDTDS